MSDKTRLFDRIYERLRELGQAPEAFGAAFAFLVMLVQPLAYQNYYFNINRFKFYMYIGEAFAAFAIYLILAAYRANSERRALKPKKRVALADAGMFLFACAASVSCAASASPAEALTGSAGRFSGLILILAMCAAYAVVRAARRARGALVAGLMISGEICAVLGILNFFRVDPLGFYNNLGDKYVHGFISTIGNIDFFGAFLCLFLPASSVMSLRAKSAPARALSHLCALTGVCAVAVARADGALIAVAAQAFACAAYALSSRRALARACAALAIIPAGFALMGALIARAPNLGFESRVIYAPLIEHYLITGAAALLIAAAALICFRLPDAPTPARWARAGRVILISSPFIMLAALICVMWYFSARDTSAPLTGALRYLRYTDTWGTYRGGVWVRCLKLYASQGFAQKLIGLGPDMLKAELALAYGDEIKAFSGLSFDNAHNEYLQYLLTLGAAGLGAYLLFVCASLKKLARAALNSPAAAACLAAACAYLIQAFFNVNQPETTPLLMLMLSAGAAASADCGDNESSA